MEFEKGHLYHIYNQGNNHQKVFFDRDNYLFFITKMRIHILPYADILAWCLMPNHFHLMVYVREVEIIVEPPKPSLGAKASVTRTFNHSIGIMLRSYTNAINKRNNWLGALFRRKTKAECLDCSKGLTPSFFTTQGVTSINIPDPEKQYPQICFDYIHANPTKAGLVTNDEAWEFSSASDYAGLRSGTLIDKELTFKVLEKS